MSINLSKNDWATLTSWIDDLEDLLENSQSVATDMLTDDSVVNRIKLLNHILDTNQLWHDRPEHIITFLHDEAKKQNEPV